MKGAYMNLQYKAKIIPGVLTSRIKEDSTGTRYKLYDNYDFYKDTYDEVKPDVTAKYVTVANDSAKVIVQQGDVVINLTLQQAAMIHTNNELFLTFNFSKVELHDDIDPLYFVYWFNQSREARNQIYKFVQSGTQTKKISIHSLRTMDITYPSLTEQQLIGKLFEARERKQALLREKYTKETQLLTTKYLT